MTKEQKEATIAALIREKQGYEALAAGAIVDEDEEALAKWEGRAAEVDIELRKLGAKAAKPASRAERRPAQAGAERR